MARAVHTAVIRENGPWLIRRERLEALDRVLGSAGSREAAGTAVLPEPSHRLEVFLEDGKKLLSSSFGEALSNYPSLERGLATGFKYMAAVGGATAVVWLEKNDRPATGAPAPDTDHSLLVEVTPEDLPAAQTLFFALVEWVESVQLPTRDKYFERYGGWLFVPALIGWASAFPSSPASGPYYKAQARELLASSGTPVDQARAVKLLLAIASDAPLPGNASTQVPAGPDFYRWVLVAVLCSLATLFVARSPTTLLGLGKGESRIALWERSRKVLIYSVPSTLVAWFVLPPILRLLGVS